MKVLRLLFSIVCVLSLSGFSPLSEDFLIIMDSSGSMGSAQQMEPIKEALRQALDAVQTPGARFGMRVYGTGCCEPDTRLEVPISQDGREAIRKLLPDLYGRASSPMALALREARLGEMAKSDGMRKNLIILSDGEVDRDAACREAALLRKDGVHITVVGFEYANGAGAETLRYIAESPDCAAGTYLRVERPDQLKEMMISAVTAAFGFFYRIIAFILGTIAAYYLTKFFEYFLARTLQRRFSIVPKVCMALMIAMVLSLAALFLASPSPGMITIVLVFIAVCVSTVYLVLALSGRVTR